jgi:hypothetical protein
MGAGNMELKILNNDEKEINEFHSQGWAASDCIITKEQLKALQEGKAIGFFDGEYTTVFKLETDND